MNPDSVGSKSPCYHCGEDCGKHPLILGDKIFCCDGCKMVYNILKESGLCEYYLISENPGNSRRLKVKEDKFLFLDDAKIKQSLISFANEKQTWVTFYLPQIHCSSCLWLLENLHHLNGHIISSTVNFARREANIAFNHTAISLRQVAELLTSIGYEPYISLNDMKMVKPDLQRDKIFKLGIAGFCFANIMLLSFPEYFGIDVNELGIARVFRWLNLVLSLPVLFYSASEFYMSAWRSMKHGFLNIDVPIVFALIITFTRSLYEVLSGTGSGYFDSITGIVFFMLIGRILQQKTYDHLSFERDYTAYFPIAATRLNSDSSETVALPDIKLHDHLLIHHQDIIPVDGILTRGDAFIDYSFVTGEGMPVHTTMGEIVYAGGKQLGGNIEILVVKEVCQSYLTDLWNRQEFKEDKSTLQQPFVNAISRSFTWSVLSIATACAVYWYVNDAARIWNSVSAVLIIACPCALLLSNTFTNGNILRLLARNRFYLRNAQAIENISAINHIVFDKTGTLTSGASLIIEYKGVALTEDIQNKVASLAMQSSHPLDRALASHLSAATLFQIKRFTEIPGKGIEGYAGNDRISLGSGTFSGGWYPSENQTEVYVGINDHVFGKFVFRHQYRRHLASMLRSLGKHYSFTLLTGDNDGERQNLRKLFGCNAQLMFRQSPSDKLDVIRQLQAEGKKVMMLGDGLNDAGALRQADVGIAVSENANYFTPASDAILDASNLSDLSRFIHFCKLNKKVVMVSFIASIFYNISGLYFAVQGNLSPMIAAVLMPASSLTILILTFGATSFAARRFKLKYA